MKSITFKGNTYDIVKQKGGRPKKILSDNEITKLLEERQIMSVKQIAALHGTSTTTIHRWFKQIEERFGGDQNG